jgi:radical SAM superfamily enzyme YgiQ (UPF0313 family)
LPDFSVRVFDLNLDAMPKVLGQLKAEAPDYVGVSMRNIDDCLIDKDRSGSQNFFVGSYRALFQELRSTLACPIILGGAGYSIYPELLFRELQPDYGIYGEGEAALVRLLAALEKNEDPSRIESLVYLENGLVKKNPRTDHLSDLTVKYDRDLVDFYWAHSGMLSLQTKRGCPLDCIYCTYPLIEGKKVRTLNPDKIVEVLKDLKRTRGINYVYFTDSLFNIDAEYNKALAHKMIAAKLDIQWGAFFAPQGLTREMLQLYKASGLTHIEFGTEALSDRVLKSYGKHFTVADVLESARLCQELNIHSAHFLILGGYGETPETLAETFENSKKIGNSIFFPFIGMRIYPNTPLQRYAVAEGLIGADDPLLTPKYYVAKGLDLGHLREAADKTGRAWILPGDDYTGIVDKLRQKKHLKGPLWELLVK